MSKIKIKKDDKERIVLTELLPYEVPILFSNEGLYSIIVNGNYNKFFNKIYELSRASGDGKKFGIPFNYGIRKNIQGDTRVLSVIHPYCQYYFIDLYKNYDSLMLHLCSKSPISLRKISKVAKFYYSPNFVFPEEGERTSEVEVEPEFLDKETKYLKSYFTYQPIDLIYKFYDKKEFQRLEQRFNYLMQFDISKCFYNIYTHSITWAVKGKEIAKRNSREKSFENSFDKLMQLSNYNETNGIVVGPEISRIFAEIILQQIDINVLKRLDSEYKFGVDYEVKRYVDDYFLFSNDEKILFEVQKIFREELSFYKLYINDTKTEIISTPFISDITVGKRELNDLLINLYSSFFEIKIKDGTNETEKVFVKIRKPFSISQNFIKDFQCIVKRNKLGYDALSKDIIRFLKTRLIKILKEGHLNSDSENAEKFLNLFFDILFYAYSLNVNANSTIKLSQIIVLVNKFLERSNAELKHNIYSQITKEAEFVLTNFYRKSKKKQTNIEILNLLIALKKLGEGYFFSEKKLRELFRLETNKDFKELNYFHFITLLYYIDTKSEYDNFRKELEIGIINKFSQEVDPFSKSEYTMLFFDFICCPFVDMNSKQKIIKSTKYVKSGTSSSDINILIQDICNQEKWFMDWDINIDLERVLKKKDFGTSY